MKKQLFKNLMLAIFLCFCFANSLLSAQQQEEIVVNLDTESSLIPVYVHFYQDSSENSDVKKYVDQLKKVLSFDLNYNGYTQVLSGKDLEAVASAETFEQVNNIGKWEQKSVQIVVKAILKGNALSVKAFDVQKRKYKTIRDIPLMRQINLDRKKVHQISDALIESLFGIKGIATTHLLYTLSNEHSTSNWMSEVWECDYDGGNPRKITHDGGFCVTPVYIPPKPGRLPTAFFYVSYRQGLPKIYVASLQNAQGRRFSPLRGNQLMPSPSLQRDKVAFVADTAGNPDLYVYDIDAVKGVVGKPKLVYSCNQGAQGSPVFNPSGDKMAFVSNKSGTPRIYIISQTDQGKWGKEVLITKKYRENTSPSWSPDGKKIAFSAKINGVRQILYYDLEKKSEVILTQGGRGKENPCWAPNSLHLVFNVGDEGASELYLVNLKQPKAVQISKGVGEKRFPNWEPRGN